MAETLTANVVRRSQLRQAVLEHLREEGSARPGAEVAEEVSLELDALPRSVLAAIWALVEDGVVSYEPGAWLRLTKAAS